MLSQPTQPNKPWGLALHGGAGTIVKELMTREKEEKHKDSLNEAINVGCKVLADGGAALDAVVASVMVLELSPLFNAGRGAVFNADGQQEMDASIMDGVTRKAGSVGAVKTVKHPILAARKVMEESPHVLMVGEGADRWAKKMGLEIADADYFFNQMRYDQFLKIKGREEQQLDHSVEEGAKFGTVGAVACDQSGNLAAATSTGGMTNKFPGRVGDTAIIGSGTYAENETCAVSMTGHGEMMQRMVSAYDVIAMMKYEKLNLQKATGRSIFRHLAAIEGRGGLVAIDKDLNIAMPFNTAGMYRGFKLSNGLGEIGIYG